MQFAAAYPSSLQHLVLLLLCQCAGQNAGLCAHRGHDAGGPPAGGPHCSTPRSAASDAYWNLPQAAAGSAAGCVRRRTGGESLLRLLWRIVFAPVPETYGQTLRALCCAADRTWNVLLPPAAWAGPSHRAAHQSAAARQRLSHVLAPCRTPSSMSGPWTACRAPWRACPPRACTCSAPLWLPAWVAPALRAHRLWHQVRKPPARVARLNAQDAGHQLLRARACKGRPLPSPLPAQRRQFGRCACSWGRVGPHHSRHRAAPLILQRA